MNNHVNYCAVTVRPAEIGDCKTIARLLLHRYEDYNAKDQKIDPKILRKDGFETEQPKFYAFLAEIQPTYRDSSSECVGIAVCSFMYDTYKGKLLYLDTLYVRPQHRRQGLGTRLMKACIEIGMQNGCKEVITLASEQNKAAKEFFVKKGADVLSKSLGFNVLSLHEDQVNNMFLSFAV